MLEETKNSELSGKMFKIRDMQWKAKNRERKQNYEICHVRIIAFFQGVVYTFRLINFM